MDILHQHQNGACLIVSLKGRFTFADNQLFKGLLENLNDSVSTLDLNLSQVEFIDSAGLGMLLLALEKLEQHHGRITLRGAQGQVQQMIDISRFEDLFDVVS